MRWNALAMVVQANRASSEYGGHIASYASAATLYEVGFNHFWRATSAAHPGDMVFMQGHSSPGIYARAYLEGRLDEAQLLRFRQEVRGGGLVLLPASVAHAGLLAVPTVSMGLGPMMAIFQARFVRYLEHRGIVPPSDRKVWAFLGDGEMDEPESMGALTMPVREKLDNLIFVINCNLQRLDGPVRGNGKIIQELEAAFLGAGWNVIKVLWGSRWDPLLERDHKGLLKRLMEECVDGEYQNFKSKGGAYTREHFFGKYPELKEMVANMSDEEIWRLNRGGHDPQKVYAAYASAVAQQGRAHGDPREDREGLRPRQGGRGTERRAPAEEARRRGSQGGARPLQHPDLRRGDRRACRSASRRPTARRCAICRSAAPRSAAICRRAARRRRRCRCRRSRRSARCSRARGDREISTTMALVRILTDAGQGQEHRQAHRADRSRRGAHLRHGGHVPPDRHLFLGRASSTRRRMPISSCSIARTSRARFSRRASTRRAACARGSPPPPPTANHGVSMVPFYIYYSMFGFQRVGDFIWAAGDSQARGFLIGGTAGRTTLAGEGLQHQDGHSQLVATTVPNCVAYDPAYAYELAVIVQDGLRRMYQEQESVFYYITCMNENYAHPAMPAGADAGHLERHVSAADRRPRQGAGHAVRLGHDPARSAGGGGAAREGLRRAGRRVSRSRASASCARTRSTCERWNLLHPAETAAQCLRARRRSTDRDGPFIAATDYMKTVPDQIRQWVPGRYAVLGTDGFGRSDSRAELRRFFEVDRHYVVVAALKALADDGKIDVRTVTKAMQAFGIDPEKPNPLSV